MNIDINDPSVDPRELFKLFEHHYMNTTISLGRTDSPYTFTDFSVHLWILSSEEGNKIGDKFVNYRKDFIQEQIGSLLAAWVALGYLTVKYAKPLTTNWPVKAQAVDVYTLTNKITFGPAP